MSLTAAMTSLRKPSLSDKGEPSSKIPPVMQRPRCSMKLPKIFLSMAPRCRRLCSCILAVPPLAGPVFMIIGAAADAASTPLREIFMTPPNFLSRISSVALFFGHANTPTNKRDRVEGRPPMKGKPGLNRRGFALATAAMPMALASGKGAAQVPAIPPPQGGAGSAGYIKPDSISTVVARLAGEPFASPIVFERRTLPIKLRPFALTQVRLGEGPFRAAQGWNAGYMKRLSVDRLLHPFRVNAAITSDARPLGG